MSDASQQIDKTAVLTLRSELKIKQWPDEQLAVVFNPHSGNSFEVDQIAARLIFALSEGALSIGEAMNVSGYLSGSNESKEHAFQFQQDYLNPLQVLDILSVETP